MANSGTVKDIIDAFDKREFTKVEEYLRNLTINRSGQSSFIAIEKDTKQVQVDRAFPWLNDIGSGPISQGLGALQAMSDVIGGVSLSGVQMFNKYNMIYGPEDMKSADERLALIIVLENLGMFDYYNRATSINIEEADKLKELCLQISRRIKSGAFIKADFESAVIIACKSVIRVNLTHRKLI